MEECKGDVGSATNASGGGVNSRWNPTKEQISLLEGLYKQGMRTPSAEQIQQITSRLRVYGHIEAKNVFYWFQNRKARQRQKEKQESFVYFNRLFHAAAIPFVSPFPPNVVCRPSYASHGGFGYCAPYQKVLPADGAVRRPRAEWSDSKIRKQKQKGYGASDAGYGVNEEGRSSFSGATPHETLQLFPLHPTGILCKDSEEEAFSSSSAVFSSSDRNSFSFSDDSDVSLSENTDLPFIDFFPQH